MHAGGVTRVGDSRDHLFEECRKCTKNLKAKKTPLGERTGMGKGTNASKSRRGFGSDTEGKFKVRPSNTAIRDGGSGLMEPN